jgi:hypothetical protein
VMTAWSVCFQLARNGGGGGREWEGGRERGLKFFGSTVVLLLQNTLTMGNLQPNRKWCSQNFWKEINPCPLTRLCTFTYVCRYIRTSVQNKFTQFNFYLHNTTCRTTLHTKTWIKPYFYEKIVFFKFYKNCAKRHKMCRTTQFSLLSVGLCNYPITNYSKIYLIIRYFIIIIMNYF